MRIGRLFGEHDRHVGHDRIAFDRLVGAKSDRGAMGKLGDRLVLRETDERHKGGHIGLLDVFVARVLVGVVGGGNLVSLGSGFVGLLHGRGLARLVHLVAEVADGARENDEHDDCDDKHATHAMRPFHAVGKAVELLLLRGLGVASTRRRFGSGGFGAVFGRGILPRLDHGGTFRFGTLGATGGRLVGAQVGGRLVYAVLFVAVAIIVALIVIENRIGVVEELVGVGVMVESPIFVEGHAGHFVALFFAQRGHPAFRIKGTRRGKLVGAVRRSGR